MSGKTKNLEVGEIIEKSFSGFFKEDDLDLVCDVRGLDKSFEDFLKFAFNEGKYIMNTEFNNLDYGGNMYWSDIADFVLKNSGSHFCYISFNMLNSSGDGGSINVLIAGESVESIESEFRAKIVEYSTIIGIYEE